MSGTTDGSRHGVAFAELRDRPVTVAECVESVEDDTRGAVVTFAGVVRNHDEGRGVERLSYSAHPSADATLKSVAEQVATVHPDVRIAVVHRVGDLAVGDLALACAVSAAHRGAAFAACAALVDEVKARVPIWKEQFFDDGSSEWVGALG